MHSPHLRACEFVQCCFVLHCHLPSLNIDLRKKWPPLESLVLPSFGLQTLVLVLLPLLLPISQKKSEEGSLASKLTRTLPCHSQQRPRASCRKSSRPPMSGFTPSIPQRGMQGMSRLEGSGLRAGLSFPNL